MTDSTLPSEETTHSFVIRFWQELPGKWRGTIRHVQSDRQRAINSARQAAQFVEQVTTAAAPLASPQKPGTVWMPRFSPRMSLALATILVVGLIGFALLAGPSATTTLAGTAVGESAMTVLIGVFIAGFVVGGAFAWLLWHTR